MRPMSEQEIWNEQIANMKLKLTPKEDFKKLLNKSKPPTFYDPTANAMERHPNLTKEEAEAIALAFGF